MKFGKLAVIGAVLAASMYLTGIARADSVSALSTTVSGAVHHPVRFMRRHGLQRTLTRGRDSTVTFTVSSASGNVFNFDLSNSGVAAMLISIPS